MLVTAPAAAASSNAYAAFTHWPVASRRVSVSGPGPSGTGAGRLPVSSIAGAEPVSSVAGREQGA